jgi:hypothetical protein
MDAITTKKYESIFKNETLALSKGINARAHEGYWLYDETLGMNIAMKAKTEQAAFVEALMYYQGRLKQVESSLHSLKSKVDLFLGQFADHSDDEDSQSY